MDAIIGYSKTQKKGIQHFGSNQYPLKISSYRFAAISPQGACLVNALHGLRFFPFPETTPSCTFLTKGKLATAELGLNHRCVLRTMKRALACVINHSAFL